MLGFPVDTLVSIEPCAMLTMVVEEFEVIYEKILLWLRWGGDIVITYRTTLNIVLDIDG